MISQHAYRFYSRSHQPYFTGVRSVEKRLDNDRLESQDNHRSVPKRKHLSLECEDLQRFVHANSMVIVVSSDRVMNRLYLELMDNGRLIYPNWRRFRS